MEGYGITRGRLSRYRLFWTKNIYDRQGAEQMFFFRSQGELCIPLQALPGIQKNP